MARKYASQCFTPLFSYMFLAVRGLLLLIPQAGKPRYKLLIELIPITTDQNLMQIYQQFLSPKKHLPVVNLYIFWFQLISNWYFSSC